MTDYTSKGGIITDRLRERIARGELAPGTLLRQRQLAEEFNVSPTPVRRLSSSRNWIMPMFFPAKSR